MFPQYCILSCPTSHRRDKRGVQKCKNVLYRMKWYLYQLLAPRGIHMAILRSRQKGGNECRLTETLLLFLEFPNIQNFDFFSSLPFIFENPHLLFLIGVAQGDLAVVWVF